MGGPPVKINLDVVFKTPSVSEQREVDEILASSPEEIKEKDNSLPLSPSGDFLSARKSHFKKNSAQIPLRIEQSTEYRYFIDSEKGGNPYRSETIAWYIWNNIAAAQEKYGWVPVAYLIEQLIQNHLHIHAGGIFKFITRFRDVLEILGNEFVGVIQYSEERCAIKINEDKLS